MYRGGRGGRGGYRNSPTSDNRGPFLNPQQSLDRANQFNAQNQVTLEVQGWQNANQQEFANFLYRKSRVSIMNIQVDNNTGLLRGTVKNETEAQTAVKCTGLRFAGDTLTIRIVDTLGMNNGSNSGTPNTIELLRNFVRSRYDSNSKMLNLEGMIHDQNLISTGLFNTANTSSKFFPALMKVALQNKIDVESMNLASNGIDDHSKYLVELSLNYPKLKNLSLANNKINRIEFFEKLKNKFSHLRELIITGNPIVNTHFYANIVTLFPRLSVLDGTTVRDESKLQSILSFPINTDPMFFESPDLQKVATNFITTYLQMWDNQRLDLLQLYTPDSQFSYQVDSSHIGDVANTNANSWSTYLSNSRNLKRVSSARQRISKLFVGIEAIGKVFQSLPKTKHTLQERPNFYSVETTSYPPLNGMHIVVHGEFEEVGQPEQPQNLLPPAPKARFNRYNNNPSSQKGFLGKRSFDRSFVVIPGGTNGVFIVASDLLLLKAHTNSPAWKDTQLKAPLSAPSSTSSIVANPPVTAGSTTTLPPEIVSKLNITQQQLVTKIMVETRLNLDFTLMLCEQSNWNYEVAGQNFQSSKSQIPPNAFQ